MSSVRLESVKTTKETENHVIPMQPASLDIWDSKYRLRDRNGQPLNSPKLIRFTELTEDEYFCTENGARAELEVNPANSL